MQKEPYCCCLVIQPCLTLCGPTDCRWPSSSVHGIFQARILEWVAIPFSRGSFQPKDQTQVSCIGRWILYHWATREAHKESQRSPNAAPYFTHGKNLKGNKTKNWGLTRPKTEGQWDQTPRANETKHWGQWDQTLRPTRLNTEGQRDQTLRANETKHWGPRD